MQFAHLEALSRKQRQGCRQTRCRLAVATVSDVISKNLQMSSEEREIGLKTMVEITLDSL